MAQTSGSPVSPFAGLASCGRNPRATHTLTPLLYVQDKVGASHPALEVPGNHVKSCWEDIFTVQGLKELPSRPALNWLGSNELIGLFGNSCWHGGYKTPFLLEPGTSRYLFSALVCSKCSCLTQARGLAVLHLKNMWRSIQYLRKKEQDIQTWKTNSGRNKINLGIEANLTQRDLRKIW